MINSAGRGKIKISDVDARAAADMQAFYTECDARYEDKVRSIVDRIARDPSAARIIMLSGPSSSCKTTTSRKIQRGLAERGVQAAAISMDDFFKPRDEVPLLPDGSRDYESLQSLNAGLLIQTLTNLIEKGYALLPKFDFKLGRPSSETQRCELGAGNVAVVEGLHALDTSIASVLPPEHILRLYVSVSSDFVDDAGNTVLSARDIRLIRRTIRDNKFRGSSPENTLDMWDTVCKGEDLYIRPFKKTADIRVNSVFACEPCLFRSFTQHLFGSIPEQSRHYERARHIIEGLRAFSPMPMSLAPDTCVLREFTGGSIYYHGKKNAEG